MVTFHLGCKAVLRIKKGKITNYCPSLCRPYIAPALSISYDFKQLLR